MALNELEGVPLGLNKLTHDLMRDDALNASIFLELLLVLVSADNAKAVYPASMLDTLLCLISVMQDETEPLDDDDRVLAARIVLKLLDNDPAYEIHVASDIPRLTNFMITFLGLASYHKDDQDNTDLSRVALAGVGNVSTHPLFNESVQITKSDPVFSLIVSLLYGSFECQGWSKPSQRQSSYYSSFKGIACLLLGNLASSAENVQKLVSEIPNLVELSMDALAPESDAFGLQGAHLVKNLTTKSSPDWVKLQVLEKGGVSLVGKLVGMKLFSNLRMLGFHIGKNLLIRTASLLNQNQVYTESYTELVDILIESYRTEDTPELKNEFILAADASISMAATQYTKQASPALSTALSKQANGVLDFLHKMYKDGGQVNMLVTLKATKVLGVLAGTLDQPGDQSLLESAVSENEVSLQKLVDVLGDLSGQLLDAAPSETGAQAPENEAASQTFKGIINNLGYIGAKLQSSQIASLSEAGLNAARKASS